MKIYFQNGTLRKMWDICASIVPSFIFCIKYLPFKQAIKLPVLVRRPKYVLLKGSVRIEDSHIRFGMIKLGFLRSRLWPDDGIIWCVQGKVIFKGEASIGAGSSIFVGENATLEFGDDFINSARLKVLCYCKVTIGKTVRFGWDCIIMDSSLHPLVDMQSGKQKKAYGPIEIGDYNWFGLQCLVMHSVKTPERCIFGARSVVTRGGEYKPYCVHGGSPIRILSTNVMRDFGNDQIKDYSVK